MSTRTHIYRWALSPTPNKDEQRGNGKLLGNTFADATWEFANTIDALLMPGREVHRLSFPFPFPHPCDFEGSNAFLADERRWRSAVRRAAARSIRE